MNDFEKKSMTFKKKTLAIAIGFLVAGGLFSSNVGSVVPDDLNIYRQPTQGQTTILLMLDSTANMDDNYKGVPRAPVGNTPAGAIYADYPECRGLGLNYVPSNVLDLVYGKQATNSVSASSANSTFPPNPGIPYCGAALSSTEKSLTAASSANAIQALKTKVAGFKYSRMDRMKIAMSLLLSDSSIDNKISLGLGQFSTATPSSYTPTVNQPNNSWISGGYVSKWTVNNDTNNEHKDGNDISAKILIANKQNIKNANGDYTQYALDGDQRFLMRAAVGVMGSGGRTPLASALAESGAYMLGNNTLNFDSTSPGTSIQRFYYNGSYRGPYTYSGFNDSNITAKNGSRYRSPIPTDTNSCNASGIFLLSNGVPTETPRATAQDLMRNALADATFSCPVSNTGGRIATSGSTDYGWTCMGAFAKRLYSPISTSIPQVKVAVAGFGNNFIPYLTSGMSKEQIDSSGKLRTFYKCNALTTGTYTYDGQSFSVTSNNIQDVKNSCNLGEKLTDDTEINSGGTVGGYGQGGFYPIVEASQLADSIKNFVADLQTDIPSLNSGLPSIPVDTLNVTQQLPFAYYSQFQPDTRSSQAVGTWVGNIKKYKAVDNTFKDKNSNNIVNATIGNLNPTTDFWSSSSDGANATQGGVSAKLSVQSAVGRKLYTDRTVVGSTVSPITSANTDLTLIASNNTSATTNTAEILRASQDPDKAYLLNLLGFGVSTPTVPTSLVGAVPLRQMGATINSTPLAFTTQSKIATRASGSGATAIKVGDYINRKDYILFGTSQGLLQVVDASSGEEKFSFLPKEMIDRQKQGFVAKTLQSTIADFYSGIDGTWSVYANYIANNESNSLKADKLNVYGGLRRGGANYYGLDLKSIETAAPKFLFKTLGNTAVGANGLPTGTCSNSAPLNCMGQSWSKPAVGWIKWKGKPQLVMIVGGGYDPVYDSPSYKSNTTATKGNGVYIFAAESNAGESVTAGDLLWWGSSTANSTSAATDNTTQKTANSNLKYSVVSEIKTVDRDTDGFIDNLYFGDLGGQVFRVDIDNGASISSTDATQANPARNFSVKRIVRIGNFITDSDRATKVAPRFYNMPTFTVHLTGNLAGINNATRYAVIGIGSGDQSSPVSNGLTTTTGLPDRVYGIFDRDIGRTDLYSITNDNSTTAGLFTGTATTATIQDIAANLTSVQMLANMNLITTKGWFNTLSGTTLGRGGSNIDASLATGVARYKVLSSFSAIKGTLFTSYFDAADNGTSSSCSAGIKGRSYIKNYCLPFGSMNAEGNNCGTTTDGRAFSAAATIGSDVGAGVIPVIVGGMSTNNGSRIGPLSGKDGAVNAQYQTPLKLEPIKWSERNM